jgi:hypothetical protein
MRHRSDDVDWKNSPEMFVFMTNCVLIGLELLVFFERGFQRGSFSSAAADVVHELWVYCVLAHSLLVAVALTIAGGYIAREVERDL